MKGIEGMLSSMLGINPSELADMTTRIQSGLLAVVQTVAEIKQQNIEILASLERLENGGSADSVSGPLAIADARTGTD